MKKLNLFTTCFLSLISFTLFGQWEIQNQIPDTIVIRDVFFISDTCGWTVGLNGAIFKTIDGGNSWVNESFYPPNNWNYENYNCVYFLDDNHGWIGGEHIVVGGGQHDRIYYTSDGGSDWTSQYYEAGNSFREILFIDDEKGFAAAYIALFYTIDGGENWDYIPTPVAGISFPSELMGWSAGGGNIMHTDDSGLNWVLQYNCQGIYDIRDIHFNDNTYGWAVGKNVNDETGVVLKTIDGGLTWFETGSSEDILWGVNFIDINYGWVIGDNGRVIYTTDGGESWNDQSVEADYLIKIFITGNYHGWITANNGLYHADLSSIVGIENQYGNISKKKQNISISKSIY